MKKKFSMRSKFAAQILFALALEIFLASAVSAQQKIENRCLFVFDTSSAMKKRLPAVDSQVESLLASSMNGQLQAGDSIGVWLFGRDLRTGQLPLQRWDPARASLIATNLETLLADQSFSGTTRFSALQPYLNGLVENSDRLTVVIFSDGDGEFTGSPYDTDINAVFRQKSLVQKRARQPFVLVLRSQLGKYAGAIVNLPPGTISLPQFPALPAPPKPPPAVEIPPAPPKLQAVEPVAAPLIIIGTNVTTNPAAEKTESMPALVKNIVVVEPPPVVRTNVVNVTNVVVLTQTNTVAVTNQMAATVASAAAATSPAIKTNAPPVVQKMDSSPSNRDFIIGGAILLAAAAVLSVFLIVRARGRGRVSLITRTMNKKQ